MWALFRVGGLWLGVVWCSMIDAFLLRVGAVGLYLEAQLSLHVGCLGFGALGP